MNNRTRSTARAAAASGGGGRCHGVAVAVAMRDRIKGDLERVVGAPVTMRGCSIKKRLALVTEIERGKGVDVEARSGTWR